MKYQQYHIVLLIAIIYTGICVGCKTTAVAQVQEVSTTSQYPPLFDQVIEQSIASMAPVLTGEISIPTPKDMGGGYTHEQHKQNYRNLQLAGQLYTITGDVAYADYIKKVFYKYADAYPTWPPHPTNRSYAVGKIFWQCLNDSNWMVYGSQAYDAVYDYLTAAERTYIEDNFLKPYADYISVDNPKFFNRVHNHSTWGNAAVGMVGLATRDEALVQRALYGLQLDEVDLKAKDNDGGYIYEEGKAKAGFFAQIDYSFSPDGYYGEGPYYQRYAMLPFMIFAQALDNAKPELEIFAYRDSLLIKAVEALMYQTTQDDAFFPINDAQKGMSIHSNSVVTAVDIAFAASKKDVFLAAAEKQNTVLLTEQGLAVAQALERGFDEPFIKQSINLRDGYDGTEGGLAILRAGDPDEQTTTVVKYTAQGMGHGHYDKLGILVYDGATEVLQDYGAARWVNIEQKGGGRYLKVNKSWGKQTVAHNTLVVDQQSHFGGKYEKANANHSDLIFYNVDNDKCQVVGTIEENAYPGVTMRRYVALWQDDRLVKPVTIDIMAVSSEDEHTYDLPYQYAGQVMQQSFDYAIESPPTIMGKKHGYQHLYQEASAAIDQDGMQFNWFKDMKFYTLTTNAQVGDEVILARAGANDRSFDIRRDALLITRARGKSRTFVSLIESHGTYSTVTEVPIQPYSQLRSVNIMEEDEKSISLRVDAVDSMSWTIQIDKTTGNTTINTKK